jgi:hypothetical protein
MTLDMKIIRIFGCSDSKKCNEAIRGLILKRINFKLHNIETDKDAYNEFLSIAGCNAEIPFITDENNYNIKLDDIKFNEAIF